MSCTPAVPNNHASVTLKLLATSDVHGHFIGYDYFQQREQAIGLAHLLPVIEQQRTSADLTLLIENGDFIQGSPLTDMLVGKFNAQQHAQGIPAVADVLQYMQYDVANLGNHEFNYGLEYLHHAYWNGAINTSQTSVPVLSANLIAESAQAKALLRHKPFHNITKTVNSDGQIRTLTIGLVGVLPPQIMQWDAHYLANHVRVASMLDSARTAITQAKQAGADLIVLVAHTGMPKHSSEGHDAEQGLWQLAQLSDVDAIIFGHQHEVFPGSTVYDQLPHVDSVRGTVFGIPAVQPGYQGSHLGVIELNVTYNGSGWQITQSHSRVVAAATEPSRDMTDYLAGAHNATQAYMSQAIGFSAHDFSLQFARVEPTHALQFIHAAQLWYAQKQLTNQAELAQLPLLSAAAPFHAAINKATSEQGDYTLISKGELTLGAIGDLYRYPNTLDVVKVTGTMLKQWLEQTTEALQPSSDVPWGRINSAVPSYQFDTFAGFDYRIDLSKPLGERITANIPLTDDVSYLVATNNYRANGGGDFAGLDGSHIVYRAPDQIQHILVSYLTFLGRAGYQQELNDNWSVRN